MTTNEQGQQQDELLPMPCPFCGDPAPYAMRSDANDTWRVFCGGCYATQNPYFKREDAITAWNRRAESPLLSQERERREAAERERDEAKDSLKRLQAAQRHLSNFLDTAEEMLGCGNTENPLLGITAAIALRQRDISSLRQQLTEAQTALAAIAEALKEPAGGSYWGARRFLDFKGIYHGDLNDLRVLNAVAQAALEEKRND